MPNPKTSLAAVAASGTPVGRWTVREITLGLSAVLESIQSPLDTGKKPADIRGWIPTLYALTHTTAESERLLAAGGEESYVQAARVGGRDPNRRSPRARRRLHKQRRAVLRRGGHGRGRGRRGKRVRGDGWLIAVAATAAERYGWTWAEIKDGCPLAALLLMIRQPGPFRERDNAAISAEERELIDWMDDRGLEPGDDVSEFFKTRGGGG